MDNSKDDAAAAALKLVGVSKSYGRQRVLSNVSFDVASSEILGVIGPSGGGKTTLLRCIDLLDGIDEGSIAYFGRFTASGRRNESLVIRDAASTSHRSLEELVDLTRREVGLVFQQFNLWDDRTVLENLVLAPVVVLGEDRRSAAARAEELCSQFGLADKLHSRAWQLSGGERQRVSILRALMMTPKLVLLDEVTSALDPLLTHEVMQMIRRLRERGLTMVIVTHHIHFASSLCDRLLFLSEGRIVQLDTPIRLLRNPANEQVRDFLNILSNVG